MSREDPKFCDEVASDLRSLIGARSVKYTSPLICEDPLRNLGIFLANSHSASVALWLMLWV